MNTTPSTPAELWKQVRQHVATIRSETARVIVGQEDVVEEMLVCLVCGGHALITGVPGLAKTLLVSTIGKILGLKFRRIQFTPDLMPADIVGSEILQTSGEGQRAFSFVPGPIFANVLLADEINRTPPKTQAALLEAMQEKQVTVAGKTMHLEAPFLVFATQNPIEHEGTYPLPEAQLDRFFCNIKIDYPTILEEEEVLRRTTGRTMPEAESKLDASIVQQIQAAAAEMPVADSIYQAVLKIVHASRPTNEHADQFIKDYVAWGAGPRASQCLLRAAKGLALLQGEPAPSLKELRRVARPVLRHRIIPNYNATGEGITVETIIDHLLKKI